MLLSVRLRLRHPYASRSCRTLVALAVAATAACGPPSAPEDGAPTASPVLATVGERQVTEADVTERVQGRLVELDIQRYEVLKEGVDEIIDEILLEEEAAGRNVSIDDLLNTEVAEKISPPTAEEVARFYEENRGQLGGQLLDDLRPSIELYLEQQRQSERRDAYLDSLRDTRNVSIRLKAPTIDVRAEGPARGPATAPVVIVEFSDFGCPYCQRAARTLDQVLERYGDKVRLVFRHYPLQANSQRVAEAAACAGELGSFWPYHDLLFEHQGAHADDDLKRYAQEIGLDEGEFSGCLDSGRTTEVVAQDAADGEAAGVTGTPSFFVNGRPVSGALPFDAFKQIIDDALAQT